MEETKPTRTAADVLLSLEGKVDQLLAMNRASDLIVKTLTNRFNQLIDALAQAPMEDQSSTESSPLDLATAPPFPMAEATPSMSVETEPVGFRRTSRPETLAADPQFSDRPQKNVPTPSVPQPEMFSAQEPANPTIHEALGTKKQLTQRVIDKNGKAIFMAEVEIINAKNITEYKGRTNAVGKWQSSLLPGKYKVVLRKRDVQGKNNIEITQDLTVSAQTPSELQTMIVK